MKHRFLSCHSIRLVGLCCALPAAADALSAQDFRHVGSYRLVSQAKITRTSSVQMPVASLTFQVHCDGVQVKVAISGQPETETTYQIYRSDGLVRQRQDGNAIEVIPGIQAICQAGGVLRHLRLSKDNLTLTTFPDAVDQTIVIHAEPEPNHQSSTP